MCFIALLLKIKLEFEETCFGAERKLEMLKELLKNTGKMKIFRFEYIPGKVDCLYFSALNTATLPLKSGKTAPNNLPK